MFNRRSGRQYYSGRQMNFSGNYGRNNFQRNEMPYPIDMLNRWDIEPQMGWHEDFNYNWDRANNGGYQSWPDGHSSNGRQNGPRKQNTYWKSKANSKATPRSTSENTTKKPISETDIVNVEHKNQTTVKNAYDNINQQLLKCHVCNKTMKDGSSFQKHLSEQSHVNNMINIAEGYISSSNQMRQEFKKVKMECTSNSNNLPKSSHYCSLCDMYSADPAVHRNTIGHRRLKQYQHPSCNICHIVFSRRIELDKHKLSASHMAKMQDGNGTVIDSKVEVMEKTNDNTDILDKNNDNQIKAVVVKKEVIIKEEKEDPSANNNNRNQNYRRAKGNINNFGNGQYGNNIVDLTNIWPYGEKDWSDSGFTKQMGYKSNQMYRPSGYYNAYGELVQPRKRFHPYRNVPNKNYVKKKSGQPNTSQSNQTKPTDTKSYKDINPQLLQCHLCNVTCDRNSFESHLSGRAHLLMLARTEQSYALTVEAMRQEFRLNEINRARANNIPKGFYYCGMCDIFATGGFTHRASNEHRDLKNFIYPVCEICNVELPSRIEWDKHKLTVEHLTKLQDSWPKDADTPISSAVNEQSDQRDKRNSVERNDNNNNAQNTSADNQTAVVQMEDDRDEKKPIPNITVLDFRDGDNLSHVTPEMIPDYRSDRAVGMSFVTELSCTLCNKLLDCEDTAEMHLRTWKHHQLFVKRLQGNRRNKRPINPTEDQTESQSPADQNTQTIIVKDETIDEDSLLNDPSLDDDVTIDVELNAVVGEDTR